MRSLVLAFLLSIAQFAIAQHLIKVGKAYARTSVNTTVFRNNSLVTHVGIQYIAYSYGEGYFVLVKRQLGSTTW